MKFIKKIGSPYSDKQIATAGKFLYSQYPGTFTAKEVLEAAKARNSPIHNLFEWDNTKAAEKYRLVQAGRLIRSIVVIIDNKETRAFTSPIKINVNGKPQKGFMNIHTAMNSEAMWAQVLQHALDDLRNFEMRYQNLRELKPIFKITKKIRKEHGKDEKENRRSY